MDPYIDTSLYYGTFYLNDLSIESLSLVNHYILNPSDRGLSLCGIKMTE